MHVSASTATGRWRRLRLRLDGEEVEAPVYDSTGGRLFKTLLSTGCRMDCRYCPFAVYCRRSRHVWTREKLVRVFLQAYREGRVAGLFLSSGLHRDPEEVGLLLLEVGEELRRRGYRGYLHLKIMPGSPGWLIRRLVEVADRVSLNLEAATSSGFSEIAPSKGSWSRDLYARLLLAADYASAPWRVGTQFVVGASGETDLELLRAAWSLIRGGVGAIHYSGYVPVPGTPLAAKTPPAPRRRVRLLYEATRLMQSYRLSLHDLEPLLGDDGMLQAPKGLSLKEALARARPEWFPVNPETATLRELLRVPGIGPKAARAIIAARRAGEKPGPWLLARLLGPRRWRKAAPYLDLGDTSVAAPA